MQQKTSDFRKNFSEGLKYARIRRNLTQADLGKGLGEGETVIANWESGRNGPHKSKLPKIGDFFGLEIDPFTGIWNAKSDAVLYEVPPHKPSATPDAPMVPMDDATFRDVADRFAIECMRRGHRLVARALMDLVDELELSANSKTSEGADEEALRMLDLASQHYDDELARKRSGAGKLPSAPTGDQPKGTSLGTSQQSDGPKPGRK